MMMQYMCNTIVVFDLDDTLYKEIDFLKSGYKKVARMVEMRYGLDSRLIYDRLLSWYFKGENAFERLNEEFGLDNPINDYLNIYRYHHPSIVLSEETKSTLNDLKSKGIPLGIISDGREITQKQKIEALGLEEWVDWDKVLINENTKYFKPSHWSFDRMMLHCYEHYFGTDLKFYYVGDNPKKDFLAPNQLGWETLCLLDDGKNIHPQDFSMPKEYLPKVQIRNVKELINLI